ncbi:MAG: hypothetical protein PHH59_15825 [Methylovulum sp.]|uniref:hypothetical protein n=1 Tax=Methylovulum sp. TaxID=1916980 RepID=UPI0026318780|nr:hypothetical protein [Methylovulum sp.]MDD2725475.1 hypothetical protein [Methylovulum sp.]
MFKSLKPAYTASVFATLMLMMPNAQAANVNYTFNGTVDSGSLLSETFSGSFSYDDLSLTNLGDESINLSTMSFNFLSNSFGLGNADVAATADFLNGVFLGVNFSVSSFDPAFALISGYGTGFLDDAAFAYDTQSGDAGYGSINFQQSNSVDAPAGIALFGLGLAGIGMMRRRVNG